MVASQKWTCPAKFLCIYWAFSLRLGLRLPSTGLGSHPTCLQHGKYQRLGKICEIPFPGPTPPPKKQYQKKPTQNGSCWGNFCNFLSNFPIWWIFSTFGDFHVGRFFGSVERKRSPNSSQLTGAKNHKMTSLLLSLAITARCGPHTPTPKFTNWFSED